MSIREHNYSGDVKLLRMEDAPWIESVCGEIAEADYIREMFLSGASGHAVCFDGDDDASVILVTLPGDTMHYIALLWTNGTFRAVKYAARSMKELCRSHTVLFNTLGDIAKRHRKTVRGESGREYFEAVVTHG